MSEPITAFVIIVGLRFLALFLPWRLPAAGFAFTQERGWHWYAHGFIQKET